MNHLLEQENPRKRRGHTSPGIIQTSCSPQTRFNRHIPTTVSRMGLGDRTPKKPQTESVLEWDRILISLLQQLTSGPEMVDEDFQSPTREALFAAVNFVDNMTEEDPPTRVVPDGAGGIVFEKKIGESKLLCEFDKDGSGEVIFFEGHRVVKRIPLR